MVIGAMIKARLGSSRFPKKHIQRLGDSSVIGHIIRKACALEGISNVIIETSNRVDDEYFEIIAAREGIDVFRGDATNLYLRDTECMEEFGLTHGLFLSGDCPMFDPHMAQRLIDAACREPWHETYNLSATYHVPMGGTQSAIETLKHIKRFGPLLAEHPTPEKIWEQYWILGNRLGEVDTMTVDCGDLMPPEYTPIETSVDYPLQLAVLNACCDFLGHFPEDYSEVVRAFKGIYHLAIIPHEEYDTGRLFETGDAE